MKKRSERMALLQDLAERRKRQADQFLADSRARVAQDESTLAQLEQYLAEYRQQMLQRGQGGIAIDQLQMMRAFVGKIESSIDQQCEAMKTNREQLARVEEYWRKTYGHLRAMQNLTDRALEQERVAAEKRLQKVLDERAQLIRPPFI